MGAGMWRQVRSGTHEAQEHTSTTQHRRHYSAPALRSPNCDEGFENDNMHTKVLKAKRCDRGVPKYAEKYAIQASTFSMQCTPPTAHERELGVSPHCGNTNTNMSTRDCLEISEGHRPATSRSDGGTGLASRYSITLLEWWVSRPKVRAEQHDTGPHQRGIQNQLAHGKCTTCHGKTISTAMVVEQTARHHYSVSALGRRLRKDNMYTITLKAKWYEGSSEVHGEACNPGIEFLSMQRAPLRAHKRKMGVWPHCGNTITS
jgi:hypothetical protein